MALRLTIHQSGYDPLRHYRTVTFDVLLIDFHEMEFVEKDEEYMMVLEAFGDDEFKLHLNFYRSYVEGRGFYQVVENDPRAVYEALEDQGYESFNHGDFSRESFAVILADIFQKKGASSKKAILHILEELVDFTNMDAGPFSQEDFYKLLLPALASGFGNVEYLIEKLHDIYYVEDEDGNVQFDEPYVNALISALTHASVSDIEKILDELTLYIDENEVDYSVSDISWTEEGDYGYNYKKYAHKIKISERPIFEWTRMVESALCDPISFYCSITDFSEHSSELDTPGEAAAILDYFDIEVEEPEDPDEPEHPVADEDGEYAVLYTKYDYDWKNNLLLDDIEEQIVVPYSSESDVDDAIELSKELLKREGSDYKQWVMTKLVRIEKPEVDPRQLEFDIAEYEPEPDPIWSDWELLDEDEDDE
jgi:hypothetical protein